ncbi:hypothetical protein N7535_003028 [Penicillium sp. DV-2018c]|nr:hypothetical protein N7461_001282 [Penicillium sp. DV-2018c]KAJ5576102.1 hypothetical protein N7535_003028 [Penicillium sp. DV-2018c]
MFPFVADSTIVSALFVLVYLTCLPSTSAWSLSWHWSNGNTESYQYDGALGCMAMYNISGNFFDWEPQGPWCVHFYTDFVCRESSGSGKICKPLPWPDVSGTQVFAFQVEKDTSGIEDSMSASPSTTGAKTTNVKTTNAKTTNAKTTNAKTTDTQTTDAKLPNAKTPTTDAKTSPTPTVVIPATTDTIVTTSASSVVTSASSGANGKHTLSSGAIAGIVVGVVAAVAIAGIVIFLIWRRRKNAARAAQPSTVAQRHAVPATPEPPSMAELPSPSEDQLPITAKSGFLELHRPSIVSEIGPGAERYELGGTEIGSVKKG